ncbi:MAG: hypothetical protein ACT4TC_22510 [Myxococcaceae bacterium]
MSKAERRNKWLRERAALGERESAEPMTLVPSDDEVLRRFPPERVVPRIREVARKQRVQPMLVAGLAVCAALFVVAVVLPRPTERAKGLRPSVSVYRQSPSGAELLNDGADVREGDLVQLSYAAGEARYGAILSVDGAGNVTQHLPEAGRQAVALGSGAARLPSAYRLDAAPSFERFIFVTAEEPFDLQPVVSAVKDGQAISSKLQQTAITLRKLP